MCPAIFSSTSTLLIFSQNHHCRRFFKASSLCSSLWSDLAWGGRRGPTPFQKPWPSEWGPQRWQHLRITELLGAGTRGDHLWVQPSTHLGDTLSCPRTCPRPQELPENTKPGFLPVEVCCGLKGGPRNEMSITKCLASVTVPSLGKGPLQMAFDSAYGERSP